MTGLGVRSELPQDQAGRDIRCNTCGWLVRVGEAPEGWIDDSLYVCGRCLEAGGQAVMWAEPPPPETPAYNPRMARIPYGDPPAPFTRPEPEL